MKNVIIGYISHGKYALVPVCQSKGCESVKVKEYKLEIEAYLCFKHRHEINELGKLPF